LQKIDFIRPIVLLRSLDAEIRENCGREARQQYDASVATVEKTSSEAVFIYGKGAQYDKEVQE